jgi:putative SOS response-associated peptidase YedK
MCGRYAFISGRNVQTTYNLFRNIQNAAEAFQGLPRYNASPMQRLPVFAIRSNGLVAETMQWWLVPHWSKTNKTEFSTFNAKAETLDKSKLFSPYFKGSRCLIPADAFYEWKKSTTMADVQGKQHIVAEKQPLCIRLKDEAPFLFAGLFSVWKDPEGKELPTFTIITTQPNELMESIHTRMPVILPEQHFEQWLDRDFKDIDKLKQLLLPYPAGRMKAYRVSRIVSNSRNDVPECLEEEKSST